MTDSAPAMFALRYNPMARPLLVVVGLGPARSRVVLIDGELDVRMGWAFRARVPLTRVVGARREPIPLLMGVGVHGYAGRWAVNGSRAGAVRLDLEPRGHARVCGVPVRLASLWVSLEDPDAFLVAVGRARRR